MLRRVLAFIAGLITFAVIVTLVQLISGLIFGMPSPDTVGNSEKMARFVAAMSVGGFVGLLISYIVGSFVAGFAMRAISRSDSLILPSIIGLIGTIGWAYNTMQISHPTWVTILGYLCYVPFASLGYRAAAGVSRGSTTV